jgi:signal transduction histidine kinase
MGASPVPRSGNEIARLAITMNTTLGRLEQSVEQQRQFVADASHELRTPLAALRAELELALNRPENAHWQQVVTDALGDTLCLQRLTTDLLLLARLDATRTDPPHTRLVDLAELVHDAPACQRIRSHLTLIRDIPPQPMTVRGSSSLLARVLENLFANAERHAATAITIRLTLDPEQQAVLSVIDDGPGIPAEHQAQIFERLTRLDGARAHDTGGAGLGLAIAHRIMAVHHGTLTLDPTATGAHFVARLPTATP